MKRNNAKKRTKKRTARRGSVPASSLARGRLPIPETVASHMRTTLVGRLRLSVSERITGQPTLAASQRDILRYIRTETSANHEAGQVAFTVFYGRCFATKYQSWEEVGSIPDLLRRLEVEPWDGHRFLEIHECPPPLPGVLGVAVWDRELLGGGKVYVLNFVDDSYPELFVARLEIRASRSQPNLTFGILQAEGYRSYETSEANDEPWIRISLRCLNLLHTTSPSRLVSSTLLECKADREHDPLSTTEAGPVDPEYYRRLRMVLAKELQCSLARVPLASIRPYDAQHALDVPNSRIELVAQQLAGSDKAQMVLYWNGTSFTMSDDYAVYLAERHRATEHVDAVVMGPLPEKAASLKGIGGAELLPGPLILRGGESPPEYARFTNRYRQANASVSEELVQVHLAYVELCGLLQSPWVIERNLHDFLLQHPFALDAYGADAKSEVWLGKQYRVDLVFQYADSDRRILAVELEPCTTPLFTGNGRWTAKVTHAIQQVRDWMRWWKEHPADVPKYLDASLPLLGLVVVGRDEHLDESAKRQMLHNNSTLHGITVITYDDLLRRLQRLMRSIGFETANENHRQATP